MNTQGYRGWLYRQGAFSQTSDMLAAEAMLTICINNDPFTVTMRTPGYEEDLAIGLLFTEGIYRGPTAALKIDEEESKPGRAPSSLNVLIPGGGLMKDFSNNRNLVSASSCGLCGKTSVDEPLQSGLNTIDALPAERIADYFSEMRSMQKAFDESGGTHAAAVFNSAGEMLSIREDIGRHNAVDKVVGDLLLRKRLPEAAILLVSGRISYEIVSKTIAAGIPVLASVSAPSGLAVEMAAEAGLSLLAFCRGDKLTVYTHPERIQSGQPLMSEDHVKKPE